jgi:hypothetical protein
MARILLAPWCPAAPHAPNFYAFCTLLLRYNFRRTYMRQVNAVPVHCAGRQSWRSSKSKTTNEGHPKVHFTASRDDTTPIAFRVSVITVPWCQVAIPVVSGGKCPWRPGADVVVSDGNGRGARWQQNTSNLFIIITICDVIVFAFRFGF